jgi:glycosyltransferase involved in cell wall biosynthesis
MMSKPLIVWQAHEGNLSGANIALLEYIDALASDYAFHILLPHGGSMEEALAKRSVGCTIVPQYGWAGAKGGLLQQLKRGIRTMIAVRTICTLLNRLSADFVFTNTLVPFAAAKAAYKLQLPHVWWIHEFGEEDFGFKTGWGKEQDAYKKMTRWSRLIICNSDAIMRKFRALMPAVPMQRIYQPVSWNSVERQRKTKLATYLMFGQITDSKGHLEVLEAVAVAKQKGIIVTLHIKGPCENEAYLKSLQQFVTSHGLEQQVQIETGFFVKEEVLPSYDGLIVASRAEAFGRVIVEAQKAGLYVLVKNSGGAPELINGLNGVVFKDKEELLSIFTGDLLLQDHSPNLTYSETTELERLKQLLATLMKNG